MNKKFLIFIVLAILLAVTIAKKSKKSHECTQLEGKCSSNDDCCSSNCGTTSRICEKCKQEGDKCIFDGACCSGECTYFWRRWGKYCE